ncbi:MAG TPA: hypothetical protein VLD40_01955 [Dissulfurispiraceae bacterium]|nr:hypothetical protein [Dissulfurispiraceae bacterium]
MKRRKELLVLLGIAMSLPAVASGHDVYASGSFYGGGLFLQFDTLPYYVVPPPPPVYVYPYGTFVYPYYAPRYYGPYIPYRPLYYKFKTYPRYPYRGHYYRGPHRRY